MLAFADEPAPPWLEEAISEDLAHSVEAAVAQGAPPCSLGGGWSRTVERKTLKREFGERVLLTNLHRSARGRRLVCYRGPARQAPDVRAFRREELNVSSQRPTLYLEALLLLRSFREAAAADDELASVEELVKRDEKGHVVRIREMLDALDWLTEERDLLGCD